MDTLTYVMHSARGSGRRKNQDTLFAYIPQQRALMRQKGALFIVADGMGGRPAGATASRLAVRTIVQHYYTNPDSDSERNLRAALGTADGWLTYWSSQREDLRGMGTTLTAAAIVDQRLYVAHVGDSRAYLIRDRNIWRLTQDQTWVAHALERGLLTSQEAMHHPWRNVLEGYLGGRQAAPVSVQRFALQPGDKLVLCSDGVSDWMTGRELRAMLIDGSQNAIRRAIQVSRRRGSRDDASMMVVSMVQSRHRARGVPAATYAPGRANTTALLFTAEQAALLVSLAGISGLLLLLLSLLGR